MSVYIGNKKIEGFSCLAPMAGISNSAYIKICEELGLGYAVTELISCEAIIRGNKKTFDMLKGIEDIKIPVAIQIFGSNIVNMAEALISNANRTKDKHSALSEEDREALDKGVIKLRELIDGENLTALTDAVVEFKNTLSEISKKLVVSTTGK